MRRPSKDKLSLAVLMVVGACALAVYWLWGDSALGQITFSIFTVVAVILTRRLLNTSVFPKPHMFGKMGAQSDFRSLVIGVLCFPGAILWGACFAWAARSRMVSDTMSSVVSLLLLPGGLLLAIGSFLLIRGYWGKNG